MVVLGVLATIAIPKFSAMRTKSFIASVTSDLKNLASQQEIYLSNNHVYASTVTDMDITLTDRVTISINEATGSGWAATGTHAGLAGDSCGMFFGDATPSNATPATTPGTVQCTT